FIEWCRRLKRDHWMHRKLWEWAYIAQTLEERDMLRPGRRGLGFAVGTEPLVSLFASFGCEIVATDMPSDHPDLNHWADSDQYGLTLDKLNEVGLCDPADFRKRVSVR